MARTRNRPPHPSGAPRDLVFISYSHRDRVWLDRLLIFLKPYIRQNLKVWADPYIETGGEWRRDIHAALSRSCVGVLLLSADFLASDFIYDDELPPRLREAGTGAITLVIIPVTASSYETTPLAARQFVHPPDKPLDGLPEPERNAAFVHIVKEIANAAQKAVSDITSQPAPVLHRADLSPLASVVVTGRAGALHGVPGQRPHHVSRPEYFEPLKRAVLGATDQAIGITGATPAAGEARIGLHGMGGIGKTVLAIDLANDDEVRRAFPDGIFWLTLGQTIEPLQLQGELAAFMAGETKAYATVNEARDQLRQLFEDKSCLLVLDDLWRAQDAAPFDMLGPRSRLLVTTRDADLLVALGARELPLDVLSPELALELLASWSGQVRDALPPTAGKVAESCGYLPLALALAGARVHGGARWQDVLSALERRRLEFLDHPYGSIFKSLRLGTDALTEFDRDRYFELAVFPEDTEVPVEAVCTLWHHTGGTVRHASEDLLLRLHRRALLIRSEDGKRISFHDLQHDFLRLNVVSLVEAHAALVKAYQAVSVSGWASGPDDGYFFQHLPQHLVAADRLDEVKALLCNYDWLAAKLGATGITGMIDDYDLIAEDPDLILVQQALRLSIPALRRDRSQMPSQLLGRLRGSDSAAAKALVAGAEKGPGGVWLRPRFASLTPPGGPLCQVLVGHSDVVTAVAVLTDGRRALSGSADDTLRLWDLDTGESLRTMEGHTNSITAVAVLDDGRRALSASVDKTLRLWDLDTGETLRTIEGLTDWVNAVAVLADGRRALSGSFDNTLRLWDLDTGKTLRTLKGHTGTVTAVAALADGKRGLSGSTDGTLRLWDLTTGETLRIFTGHTGPIEAVAVLADGRRVLSGSDDGTLRLWDSETGKTLRTLEGHTDSVTAVAVLDDERRALSGSLDATLRLWDLDTGETRRIFEDHTATASALAMLADGRRALSGSGDGTLRLWDLDTGETLRSLEMHTKSVLAVAVLPDGSRALSGSADSTLRLWDLHTGESSRTFEGHMKPVSAVAVLAEGSRALSGSADGTLRLWDLATGDTLRRLEGHTDEVNAVAALADGRRALSGSRDKTLRLWDLDTGETVRTLEGHTDYVRAVAVLTDGRRALSSSLDKTLRLWDLDTGETLRTIEGLAHWVIAVAVLAGGRHALLGSLDNTLRLWDLDTGGTLRTLEGHAGAVSGVAVLADGRRTLSCSWDETLRLWDLETGNCLAGFTAEDAIDCVTVTRDDVVVAGSQDGRVHILEIRQPAR
jgi:WD40 repeat protein